MKTTFSLQLTCNSSSSSSYSSSPSSSSSVLQTDRYFTLFSLRSLNFTVHAVSSLLAHAQASPFLTSVSTGEAGVASIEHPESVRDSFIFSPSPEVDEGVGESNNIESSGEVMARISFEEEEESASLGLATLRVVESPREMHEVEGLLSFRVLAPIRGNALRSAVG